MKAKFLLSHVLLKRSIPSKDYNRFDRDLEISLIIQETFGPRAEWPAYNGYWVFNPETSKSSNILEGVCKQ